MAETYCRPAIEAVGSEELFSCAAPRFFDAATYRKDFPALQQTVHGKPLVYLDNGASAQKPRMVLEAMTRFYENDYANVHRGVHTLSQRATDAYEAARERVRLFLHAPKAENIVFTRGATEAINLVAHSWGRSQLKAGDEILITALEHHANIVPWQMLAEDKGVVLKVIPITDEGDVLMDDVRASLSPRTRLISVAHVSNALGTVLPVTDIIALARSRHIPVLLDGCQAAPHMPVDVQDLGCTFYAFSGHKVFGPTGIGALYVEEETLHGMPPYQTGGDMIETVSFKGSTFKSGAHRFEAGTPAIAEAVGLAAALEYVSTIGLARMAAYEHDLLGYATEKLSAINSLRIIGTAPHKAAIVSFVMDNAHPHDVGTILDHAGVAVRTGHHCAQPLMERLGVPATTRASFAFYNTRADVDALVSGLHDVRKMFP